MSVLVGTRRAPARWALAAVFTAVLAALAVPATPTDALGATQLRLPFAVGQAWYVCQGYNGSITHQGGPDLDVTTESSRGTNGCWGDANAASGKPIYAPGTGALAQLPGSGGGICITFDAGGSIYIGHLVNRRASGPVKAGDKIGDVASAGQADNGGYAHAHLSARSGTGCGGTHVPFADAYGKRFAGAPDMTYSGAVNQWAGTKLLIPATKGFTTAPTPTISGTAWVDSTLTANRGTWSPTPDSYKYQWRRDGASISGATGSTYKLGQADIGKRISVSVAAVKSGYTTTTKTSGQTAAIGAYTFSGNSSTPTIGGVRVQGSTLSGKPGTWTLSGATYKYQWKRAGWSIPGATGLTYKLNEADIGKTITFTVSAVRSGYKTVSKTSSATSTIKSILGDTLNAGSKLSGGKALYSLNGKYKFVQQTDGNLVLYNLSTKKAVWATGRLYTNTYTIMQSDGNLVQYRVYSDGSKKAVWATGTNGKGGTRVVVQNDGNVVIYTSTGKAVWASNTVGR